MTQHTAQHLLSAILDNHYALPTLSWALPAHPSVEPCYVELPRGLSQEEIDDVEKKCNELVTRQWGAKPGVPQTEGEGDTRVWIESRLQGSSSTAQSGSVTPATNGNGNGNGDGAGDVQKEMQGLGLGDQVAEYGDRESRGLPKDYEGVGRAGTALCLGRRLTCRCLYRE